MLIYCRYLAVLISNKHQSTRLISLDYVHIMVCWHDHQNKWEIVISNLAPARVSLLSIDNRYLEIGGFDIVPIFCIYSTELGYCVYQDWVYLLTWSILESDNHIIRDWLMKSLAFKPSVNVLWSNHVDNMISLEWHSDACVYVVEWSLLDYVN